LKFKAGARHLPKKTEFLSERSVRSGRRGNGVHHAVPTEYDSEVSRRQGTGLREGLRVTFVERVKRFLNRDVWMAELGGLPALRAACYKVLRVLFLAARGFVEDRCLFRASALAYITVLSLVPMLAFSFSVAKGLGAYDRLMKDTIQPFLDRTIGTGGAGASELRGAVDQLLDFVSATNVGSLGFFGLVFLAYTVIKLLSSIERSFNDIWGVCKARSLVRKVSDYLSMVTVVPILLATATAATTALTSTAFTAFLDRSLGLGPVREFAFKLVPLASMWVGFGFVYIFMPNTRTRLLSAAIGGVMGGTLWYVAQILHVRFQVGMANYNAIYSGFAAIPIFLLWIYVSWVAVLFGAEFAFAHQNEPAYRQIARSRYHDQSFKRVLGVRAVVRVARAFLAGRRPYGSEELAAELGVPERSLLEVLARMQKQNIVVALEEGFDSGVLPARDLETIRLKDVLDALEERSATVDFAPLGPIDRELDSLLGRYEEDQRSSPNNPTLRELGEKAEKGAW
jgi:membrane protein